MCRNGQDKFSVCLETKCTVPCLALRNEQICTLNVSHTVGESSSVSGFLI